MKHHRTHRFASLAALALVVASSEVGGRRTVGPRDYREPPRGLRRAGVGHGGPGGDSRPHEPHRYREPSTVCLLYPGIRAPLRWPRGRRADQ